MAGNSRQQVVQIFERKFGKNLQQEIDANALFSLLGQHFELDLFTKCNKLFVALDTEQSGKVRFDAMLNHESFVRLMQTRTSSKRKMSQLQSFDESVESFPDDFDDNEDEKNSNHNTSRKRIWSYQDVELVQMQVGKLFRNLLQDSKQDTVDLAQFCAVVKDLLPSSVVADNQRICQFFDSLDTSQRGQISYHAFLKTNVFVSFLRTMLKVEISEYRSISRQATLPRNDSVQSLHGDLLYRALSIRHDTAAIVSNVDTIQRLEHWINAYGKPAQLKCQQLQMRLEESDEYRHILQQQIEELEYELSEFRNENALLSEQTTELEQFSASLEQQMSFMHEENQHLKSSDRHSYQLSVEYEDLQSRLTHLVDTEQKALKENDVLKKMNDGNAEYKARTDKKIGQQRQMLKKLWTEKENLRTKNERLNAVIAKQERELSALQSEVSEHMQMIVSMQQSVLQQQNSKKNVRPRTQTLWMGVKSDEMLGDQFPDDDASTRVRRTDTIDTTDVDIELTMLDRDDSPLYDDQHEAGVGYDMVSVSMTYVDSIKSEINALQHQLQEEQTKREVLQSQVDALHVQLLQQQADMADKDKGIAAGNDEVVLHVNKANGGDDDDEGTPDELQPFVADGGEDKDFDNSSVDLELQRQTQRRRPKCCFFLFG
mmetsp:Transcript_29736/g.48417  ORF Transcript_29736/g.48417 Transcript_29736/m.48417 type:complete len:657 (+) Transcript_29736:28-1998(+)